MKKWLLRVGIGLLVVLVLLVVGVVVYVETTAESRLQFPDTEAPAIQASTDPAVIERGRLLAHGVAHCAACHGTYDLAHPEALREDVALSGGATIEPPFGVFRASNITPDRATGIGAWSDAEIARTIRTGVRRNGELSVVMKTSVGDLGDDDLTALVSYLRSLEPVRNEVAPSEPSFLGRALVAFLTIPPDPSRSVADVPEGAEPSIERGRYLATGPGLCIVCHSPAWMDDPLTYDRSRRFAGGDVMGGHDPAHPDIEYAAPNLTSDEATGFTGRSTEEQFIERFRVLGRTSAGSPMPWENFGRLSDGDLRSIYRYIRSLPAIHHDNGPGWREAGSFEPPEE